MKKIWIGLVGVVALSSAFAQQSDVAQSSLPNAVGAAVCKVNDPDLQGVYDGDCVNGFADGNGKAVGRDSYVGAFKKGDPDGKGEYVWGPGTRWTGDRFVGEFSAGDRVKGVYEYKSGVKEEGVFKYGRLHGFGRARYPKSWVKDNLKSVNSGVLKSDGDFLYAEGLFFQNDFVRSCDSAESCRKLILSVLVQQSQNCQLAKEADSHYKSYAANVALIGGGRLWRNLPHTARRVFDEATFLSLPRAEQEKMALSMYEISIIKMFDSEYKIPEYHKSYLAGQMEVKGASPGDVLRGWVEYCGSIMKGYGSDLN